MRLLIVDDSKSMRLIIKRTIGQAGFDNMEITEAVDGEDAIEKIADINPHIVLCDWNMPGKTGIEVLRIIREAGNKVLFGFVTSESTDAMRETAKEAGAQFYITKPFTPEKFGEQLNSVLKT